MRKKPNLIVPYVSVVYDRQKRATADKPGVVEIRVTMARVSKYFPTGVRVFANEFQNGKVVNRMDCVSLNERISIVLRKVEKFISSRLESAGNVSFPEIKELFKGEMDSPYSFYDFCVERARIRVVSEGTRERYWVFLRNLKEFGQILSFSDLTVANVTKYDEWLHSKGLKQNTVYATYTKNLKMFIAEAVRFGKIDASPYQALPRGFVKRGEKENTEYLTMDEVKKIEDAVLPTEHLRKVRDLFLFQCYTGLSYSDLMRFDFADYQKVNGYYTFSGKRQKTGINFTNVLLPKAMEIVEKHCLANLGKFPKICNADYNHGLKTVAAIAGITKRVHSHLARHTFATLMLGHGVAVENVARMLGHATLRQTQHYAKVLEENIVNDVVAHLG